MLVQQVVTERGIVDFEWMKKNDDEITTFCKNANYLEVTKGKSLSDDLAKFEAPEDW